MHKKTTLKHFKVLQLKTILTMIVLGFLFQGTYAQSSSLVTTNGTKNFQPSEVPAIQKMLAGIPEKGVVASTPANQSLKEQSDRPEAHRAYVNSNKPATNPIPNSTTVACLFPGSLAAGDLTMPLRLFRPGTAGGTCAVSQPFPGTAGGPSHFYDLHTFTNTTGGSACVIVNLTTTDLVNANIQFAAYLGTFNPANLATNYIADPYSSSGTPAAPAGLTASFNLANGATMVIAVFSANASTAPSGTASNYTLSIDGLPNLCTQPPCVPPSASVISAVSALYNESFDGVIPAAGWPIQNNSAPVGAVPWNQGGPVGVFPAHSGAGFASANFNSVGTSGTISNWMFGPNVTLRNGDSFTFWTRIATGGGVFPDRLQVRMSTNGSSIDVGTTATSTGDFSTLLLDINPTYTATGYPEVWTQFTCNISGVPAAGISGRVAFRYFVENAGLLGANSNYIGIDDAIYNSTASPSICVGGTANIKVNITGGTSPYTVVYTNGTTNFTVLNYISGTNIPVSPVVPTTYTLVSVAGAGGCLGTGNSGSAVIGISSASTAAVLSQAGGALVPTVVFNQGFDAAIPPAGWFVQNNSTPLGATGWTQGGPLGVFPPHSGAGFISANFNNTGTIGTISNWLVVPATPPTLKNGDVLKFWTRTTTGAFPDRLQVRMNTTNGGTNVGTGATGLGDFTTLLLDINPTYTGTGYPTAWTEFTITLSGLPAAGTTGRLAFRYFVENAGLLGSNSDFIGIDDVSYTTLIASPPPLACIGSTPNLKVDITGGASPYTVVINAVPGGNIIVNNYVSGSNIPVTPVVNTTYTLVSVTSAQGCVGTGNSGVVTITITPLQAPVISVVANPDAPLCAGDPTLLTVVGGGGTATFTSAAPIVINASGNAAPYPSPLVVSGLPAGATVRSVTINGISHTFPDDIDMLLQGPTPTQNVVLISDVSGTNDWVNQTFVLQDGSPLMSDNGVTGSGTWAPTNFVTPDTWAPPGPGPITQATPLLSTFTGNLNGTWNLFIVDDLGGDAGSVTSYTIIFNLPPGPLPANYTYLWTPAAGLSSTTTNPVAASPMVTTTYTVTATDPLTNCPGSATKTVVIWQRPAITTHPTNITACAGSSVSFTAAGTGQGATFQWQVSTNGGGLYTNLANGAPYSGVTTQTLTINPVTVAMSTNLYRLVVSGTCAPPANSTGAMLTVNALPAIVITPVGPVCGGIESVSGTLLTAGSAAPPIPGTLTVNSGALTLAIPDGPATWPQTLFPGVATNMTVAGIPANATITGMSVKLNLTHTYIADMVIVLKAPNGAVLNLDANITRTGGAGANFINTIINSTSTAALSSGAPPYSSVFAPDAAGATYSAAGFTFPGGPTTPAGYIPTVSTFSGLYTTPNGTWSLGIYDWGAGDLGTLTNWEMVIDYTTPGGGGSPLTYTWSPATGLYLNATATIPYVAGTQTPVVYAAPTVNTVYTVTGTDGTTGCTNTGTVTVIYTPGAPIVVPASASVCLGGTAQQLTIQAATPVTQAFNSGTINLAVPDNTAVGVSNDITVAGLPPTAVITNIYVTLNMSHTYPGDMIFNLRAPNGQIFNLYKYAGGNFTGPASGVPTWGWYGAQIHATGTTTPFSTVAAAPFIYGAPPTLWRPDALNTPVVGVVVQNPNGFPSAAANFSDLYSVPNGAWTLAMADGGPGDVGSLASWSINITYLAGNPPPVNGIWTPAAGLFTDPGAGTPYVAGTPAQTVYALPTTSTTYSVTVSSLGPDAFTTFTNPAPITINDGNGTPYPANLVVSGLPTTGAAVKSVTLTGVNHTWASDVDIVLQSPTGQNVILMSDVGGNVAIPNATYTFDDAGGAMSTTGANATGTYHPSNMVGTIGIEPDNFPAPGPGSVPQPAPALSMFGNTADVNGTWKLFVFDDAAGDVGNITGGFAITFSSPTAGCTSAPRLVPVTVNIPVAITGQPANTSVCTDKVTTFSVTVTGTTPTFQWQVSTDNGNNYSNVANGGVYSGATTNTLTITAPPVSMSGYMYRVIINGTAPCGSVTSFQRVLTVNPLPTVVISGGPTRLLPGMVANLTSSVTPFAAAQGGYTWLRDGVAVPGGTNASITVGVDAMGAYSLRVTDVNGCTNTSNVISILDSASSNCFIYPNPNNGQFQVRYHSVTGNVGLPRTLTVFDSKGERVLSQNYTIGQPYDRMDVDLRRNGKGLYWVEVADANGNRLTMCRVVIQ